MLTSVEELQRDFQELLPKDHGNYYQCFIYSGILFTKNNIVYEINTLYPLMKFLDLII